MIGWLVRRAKREACRQLVNELFMYNKKDYCFDPIGSIDRRGLDNLIESIVQERLAKRSVKEAKELWK